MIRGLLRFRFSFVHSPILLNRSQSKATQLNRSSLYLLLKSMRKQQVRRPVNSVPRRPRKGRMYGKWSRAIVKSSWAVLEVSDQKKIVTCGFLR